MYHHIFFAIFAFDMDAPNFARSFADTGLWKLFVSISPCGISAFFKNTLEPVGLPVVFLNKVWETDGARLLENIEVAV